MKHHNRTIWQPLISAAVLIALGLVIRIPYLHLVPHWSGGNENYLALEILEGARPLTNQNPHLGALSPYIIALGFYIFGVNTWIPRVIPLIFGMATILLTWRLGALTASRRAGFMAAVLMCGAFYHVVFTSHFPWSNNLTPFFATAFLLVFYHLIQQKPPPRVNRNRILTALLAGLLFGMGMQTHPEMVNLLPAVAVMLALQKRHVSAWLKSPVPWLMLAGAVAGYGNMILYNLSHRFQSVSFGLTYPEYALTQEYTTTSLAGNYWREFLYLPRIILGYWDDTIAWSVYARYPMIWIFWLLVITGTVISIRAKRYLVPAAFWSMFLTIPVINSGYVLHLGRYLVFMFPPALILVAETLDKSLKSFTQKYAVLISRLAVTAVFALLFILPVRHISDYYRYCEEHGRTRERYFHALEIIQSSTVQNPLILVDDTIAESSEFIHFFRENRYPCHPVRFSDHFWSQSALEDIAGRIRQIESSQNYDGIILMLTPSVRRDILCNIPVTEFLGQVDARFYDRVVDFFRIYQL